MNPRLPTGLVLGVTLLSGAASAAPFIAQFEAHDDMHAGALWRNDRPNNNNQRGAGAEHTAIVQLSGGYILVFATASYTNVTPLIPGAGLSSAEAGVLPPSDGDPGVDPRGNRVEGLCVSYKLDATKGLVMNNMAYFTDNDSPDWQNAHRMAAAAVDGGKVAAVVYGYDPNGVNTKTYGKVIGPNCELLSQQTQLFANNNDDLGGNDLAPGDGSIFADAGGKTRFCGALIGNGNGDDDGWAWCATSQAVAGGTGTGSYTLTPNFKIVTENNEERTRAYVSKTSFDGMMLSCWAAGNNQPPNRGLRCGMINTAEGVANDQRLVWRQYVQQRQDDIYYTTPGLATIRDATGKQTDKFFLNYVMVNTANRNGRAKGKTTNLTVPIQVSLTGLQMLGEPQQNLFGISDNAHPTLVEGVYGVDKRPVAFMFTGSITDGGQATTKILGISADNKLEPIRALNWAQASSGGYTSQWYGHNPNTPQGRTYPSKGIVVTNPGYKTGAFQPDVQAFMAIVNVYHKDHLGDCTPDPNKGTNNGTCGGKNALGVSLVPVAADPASNPNPNPDPNDPTPTDPTNPNGSDSLGGCSAGAGGSAGMGTLLLIGLAISIRRRRR